MPQPHFILRNEQVEDDIIRVGGHVHFLSIDHPYEPLYEIVADPDNATAAGILAHLYDNGSDRLWELRDVNTGRIVHSDLMLRGWRNGEEVTVPGPTDALGLADRFGVSAHQSGIPPIPELDANYVTAVTLWPAITDTLRAEWLGSWFEADFTNPGVWDDVDWSTELDGSRYADMPPEKALTAAAVDLEIAVKAALPRNLLPTHFGVRQFLHGDNLSGPEPALDSVRGVLRGVDAAEQQPVTALETASGPLTAPAAPPTASSPATVTPHRRASEFPGAGMPPSHDQPPRIH